ncbi:MAG: TatD family hydrolase [Candidatus Bathyarchaeia archaeon]|nr:TatD family hydrolase [Candidatus Bathyarchaeota archaeon]
MLIDSHAHLQWEDFEFDRDNVILRAKEAGVATILIVGYDLTASEKGVELAEKYSLHASVGIHPHEAEKISNKVLDALKALCLNPRVVAIGEIGLDYYKCFSSKKAQLNAFLSQIELAKEVDKPVIIHDREAHGEVLEILNRSKGKIRGVMHCFSGSFEMAKQCIKLGFLISFAGPVTFQKSVKLHRLAKEVPLEYILVETDSPWLAPQSKRGKRNEPAYIVEIVNKIAELRGESFNRIAELTFENAKKLFEI